MKILFFIHFIVLCFGQDFDSFKAEMENKVKILAQAMSDKFADRCDSNILQCEIKSYNQCEGTDAKMCYDEFPKPSSCVSSGAYLSTTSAVRFPNNVNANSLAEDERHFVCTSATIESSFEQLNSDRNGQYGSAFIGTSFGSMRTYPTFRQTEDGLCVDYDPRYRPWYVTATSGGKNIVLVIDISGSMDGNRL